MKNYEGHPWLKNLPWYVKWMIYIGTLVLLAKLGIWLMALAVVPAYVMLPIMVIGALVVLHFLGPPKEDRK